MDRICVGRILDPHGLNGWLKVRSYTENPEDLFTYAPLLTTEGKPISFVKVELRFSGLYVVQILGITNRTQAEAVMKDDLWIHRATLPALDQDSFYFHDLVGLSVVSEETVLGTVAGVNDYGAGLFLDIQREKGVATLPFHKDSALDVDLEKRTLTIDPLYLLF